MPKFYDLQTGEEVAAYGEEAAQLLAAGKIGALRGSRVEVVSPDGRFGSIPAESLHGALARGFRPPSLEQATAQEEKREVGSAGQLGLTALEGAGRAFTMGLTDVVAAAGEKRAPSGQILGDDERDKRRRAMRLRKEHNPKAEFAGEVGGIIASLAIDAPISGPGLAMRAGKMAKTTAQGASKGLLFKKGVMVGEAFERPIAGAVAGAAVEGGLYGLGAGVSEAALTDQPDVAAEKILAGTIGGVLSGAALGGVGYGAGKLGGIAVDAVVDSLGSKSLRGHLEEGAESLAVRQFALKSDLSKYGLSERTVGESGVGRYMLSKLGMHAGDTAESLNGRAAAAVQELEGKLGGVLSTVDASRKPLDISRLNSRVQTEVLDAMKGPGLNAERRVVKQWLRDLQNYAPGGPNSGEATFTDAFAWQRKLGQTISPNGKDTPLNKQNLDKIRDVMLEEIQGQASEISPHFGKQIQALRLEQANALEARRITQGAMERQAGNTPGGLLGNLVGIAGAVEGVQKFGPAGVVVGPALGFAHSQVRKRAGTIGAVALDKLAKSNAPAMLAKGFEKFVQSSLRATPTAFGVFRGVIETAAARGADALLATHTQLARTNPEYLTAAGLQTEDPEMARLQTNKLHGISQLQQAVDAQDAEMDVVVDRFMGTQGGRAPRSEEPAMTQTDYAKSFATLTELATDPQKLADSISVGELRGAAPEVAAHLTLKAAQAVRFLHDMAPKPPTPGVVPALDQEWEPSWVELQRWGRYVEAVQNPAKAVDQLRHGTMSKEAVDTLRAIYPGMLQDIQKRMIERLAQYKQPLDPSRKAALAILFDQPMGGMGDPARIALMQVMHHATMSAEAKPAGKAGDGRQDVSTPDNMETQSQRLESRGQS